MESVDEKSECFYCRLHHGVLAPSVILRWKTTTGIFFLQSHGEKRRKHECFPQACRILLSSLSCGEMYIKQYFCWSPSFEFFSATLASELLRPSPSSDSSTSSPADLPVPSEIRAVSPHSLSSLMKSSCKSTFFSKVSSAYLPVINPIILIIISSLFFYNCKIMTITP